MNLDIDHGSFHPPGLYKIHILNRRALPLKLGSVARLLLKLASADSFEWTDKVIKRQR